MKNKKNKNEKKKKVMQNETQTIEKLRLQKNYLWWMNN